MQVRGSKSFPSFLHVHEYNRWIKKSAFYSEVQLGRLQQQVHHGCKSTTWRSVKFRHQTSDSDCESFSNSSHTSFIFITNINFQNTMCLQVSACPRPERVSNSVWTEVMPIFVVKRQSSNKAVSGSVLSFWAVWSTITPVWRENVKSVTIQILNKLEEASLSSELYF